MQLEARSLGRASRPKGLWSKGRPIQRAFDRGIRPKGRSDRRAAGARNVRFKGLSVQRTFAERFGEYASAIGDRCRKGRDELAKKHYACSSKTRKRIYETAIRLFAEKGYQAVTLSDIAQAADVSTGTLYRYFPSKGDFLVYVGRESVEHLEQFAENLPEGMPALEAVLAVLLEDIKGTKRVFFTSGKSDDEGLQFQVSDVRLAYSSEIYSSKEHLDFEIETRRKLCDIYEAILAAAQSRGELDASLDLRVVAQIIVAIFFQELDRGMYNYDYPYEPEFRGKLGVLLGGHR